MESFGTTFPLKRLIPERIADAEKSNAPSFTLDPTVILAPTVV